MNAPSRKSASFELALPLEVAKLNERHERSFDQLQNLLSFTGTYCIRLCDANGS